jgi:hypothetical protein
MLCINLSHERRRRCEVSSLGDMAYLYTRSSYKFFLSFPAILTATNSCQCIIFTHSGPFAVLCQKLVHSPCSMQTLSATWFFIWRYLHLVQVGSLRVYRNPCKQPSFALRENEMSGLQYPVVRHTHPLFLS